MARRGLNFLFRGVLKVLKVVGEQISGWMDRSRRARARLALLSFTRPWRASCARNNVFAYTWWCFVHAASYSMVGMPLGLSVLRVGIKMLPKEAVLSVTAKIYLLLSCHGQGAPCCNAPAGYPGGLTSLLYWGGAWYSIGSQTWLRLAGGSIWCPHWFKSHNYVIKSKVIGAYLFFL